MLSWPSSWDNLRYSELQSFFTIYASTCTCSSTCNCFTPVFVHLYFFTKLPELNSKLMQIPADMVVNCMIVAMVAYANQSSEIILHMGSSWRNPLKFSSFGNLIRQYFTKNPLVSKSGKSIKVNKVIILRSMASFRTYMAIRYILPLKVCLSVIHNQNYVQKLKAKGLFGSCF
jgi:hypothetical protein